MLESDVIGLIRGMLGSASSRFAADGVQAPLARHSFSAVRAAIFELEARSPATRSRTVLETSTSPGPASAATRAPMCTAIAG